MNGPKKAPGLKKKKMAAASSKANKAKGFESFVATDARHQKTKHSAMKDRLYPSAFRCLSKPFQNWTNLLTYTT